MHNTCIIHVYSIMYVLRIHVKRYNFAQIDEFELVYCFAITVNELHVALLFQFSSCFRCRDMLA